MAEDVRVRLSAEGVQEVVDAMRRIREEAKQTGEEGAKSFEAMKDVLHEVGAELIGFLAIGAVIEKTKELVSEVFNSAQAIGKLHEATGLSVQSLQAMGQMAEDASVSQETLNKGLGIFTRNVGLAAEGSKKASQGFSQLGISVKDLQALSPDEQFQLVATKLEGIENASQRAALGSQIFGKSFLEMQPVLEEVANGGMGGMIAQMQRMGTLMDDDVIKQMQEAKKAANDMEDQLKGLATEFLVGLMPAASKAMNELVDDTTSGTNAFKTLGEWAGKVVDLIVTGFRIAGATVGYVAAQIENAAEHGKDALKEIGAGSVNVLKNALPGGVFLPDVKANTSKDYQVRKDAISDSYGEQLAKIMEDYNKPPELPESKEKKRGDIIGGVDANAEAIGKARLKFIEAQLQAELAIFNAQAKLREDADKQAYEEGTMSLQDYFADREQILNQRYDKELAILKQKRAAIAAQPVDINDNGAGDLAKRAELAQIDGEISAKQFEQQSSLASLKTEERQAQMKFYSDSLKAEEQLYKIQGDKAAAAKLQLAADLQSLDTQLRKAGVAEQEREAALKTAADQGLAKINYDQTKQDADATLSKLNTQIAAIQNKVKDGTLFPVQAEQQIMDLERQRLPLLQQMAKAMQDLAKETGDATAEAQADQFAQKVKDIGTATNEAGQQIAALKQTAQDSLQNGISGFLDNVATGTMSVSDSFRKMVNDIATSLVELEAKFLANQFIKWLNKDHSDDSGGGGGWLGAIGSLFGGSSGGGDSGGGSGGGSWLSAIAGLFGAGGKASGGQIRGPGTSTSDSIPAMLSDGEFVVNARSASQPGVMALLHAINGTPGYARASSPGVQRYADGGSVAGGGMTVQHYHVDASEIPQHILQQHIDNAVLNVIAKHPVKVRNSIG